MWFFCKDFVSSVFHIFGNALALPGHGKLTIETTFKGPRKGALSPRVCLGENFFFFFFPHKIRSSLPDDMNRSK